MNKKLVLARLLIFSSLLLVIVAAARAQHHASGLPEPAPFQTRCGWFSNPTPANASLYDRDREWIIGRQGGHQAEGDWPDFKPRQWVRTSANYGYGCACLRLRVNRETHEVVEIAGWRVRPLSVCRRDRSLTKWKLK